MKCLLGGQLQRQGTGAQRLAARAVPSVCKTARPSSCFETAATVVALPARLHERRASSASLPHVARPELHVRLHGAPRSSAVASYSIVPVAAVADAQEDAVALPLPRTVESVADNPLLHNPLQRMERLGTNWFGVIADYEGVVVDSTLKAHQEAWRQAAAEMNHPVPLGSTLSRITGVCDDAVRATVARAEHTCMPCLVYPTQPACLSSPFFFVPCMNSVCFREQSLSTPHTAGTLEPSPGLL